MTAATQHDTIILPGDAAPRDADALPRNARLQNDVFEIQGILGRGEQGITYRGMDISLQRAVAIKEFFPLGSARKGAFVATPTAMAEAEFFAAREHFGHQARLLARFNHENIARIFRVFEENNSAYMVMELLEGQTLHRKLESGALPVEEAVAIATHVASALNVVHRAQLLHRAVSPANVFLTKKKRTVLINFVAARGISQFSQTVTISALNGYASIEQYSDKAQLGPQTDVYGLGATLYHALSGQAPAAAPDRLAGVDLPLLEEINPQIPPALSRVVMEALEVQPQNRTQRASEFANALESALAPDFSLAPHFSPIPRTPPAPRPERSPRTPAAPPRGATTVALPDSPSPIEATERAASAGSTPIPAPPIMPRSTPAPPPGVQMCPHCQSPMPTVMSRCPHCRQFKNKAPEDPTSGAFREWHRNENTRIGLGWALAIGLILLILFALAGGLTSLGLGTQRASQTEKLESLGFTFENSKLLKRILS